MLGCMTAVLTIAFVPGVSPAKWARVWRERFPSVELALRPIGSDEVASSLAGEVDMAFVRMPVAEDLNAIPLWTETAVVAMPKDAALADRTTVTVEDLADLHVIDAGPVPADVDGSLDLVEANVGVVVLPQSLFRKASRKGLVARELVGAPGTRVALVWRDEDASETTDEFIGVVRGRTANSSRSQADQPGGAAHVGTDGSRPAGGAGTDGGRGSGGGSGSGGGKAKAGTSSSAAKRGATKGTGGRGGGGKNSSGRGRTQRGMKGKPSRGSKGNR
jgi:hypothetical protein